MPSGDTLAPHATTVPSARKARLRFPPAATAATGVDAMTHSLESLLSKNPNPFAEAIALFVYRIVREAGQTIEGVVEVPRSGALNEHLDKSVEELELSVRSYNCLKNANIRTIRELVGKTEAEMLKTKNFGRKSLNEVKESMKAFGLSFGMNITEDDLKKLMKEHGTVAVDDEQ